MFIVLIQRLLVVGVTVTLGTVAESAPASTPDTVTSPVWPSLPADTYDVVVTTDLVYGHGEIGGGGSFVELLLDLYEPQDTEQAVLPWSSSCTAAASAEGRSRRTTWSTGHRASRGGGPVASIDYRLMGMNPVPSTRVQSLYDEALALDGSAQELAAVAAIDDTLAALDFLIARPDTADAMTTLVGGSAGAVTVDYVAYALDDFGIERPPIAAVVSNWGGLPFGGTAATFVDNPVPTVEAPFSEPPVYLAHATGDPTVPYSLSTAIAAQASAVGLDHELYTKERERARLRPDDRRRGFRHERARQPRHVGDMPSLSAPRRCARVRMKPTDLAGLSHLIDSVVSTIDQTR